LAVHDAFVKANTLIHGNWDAHNNDVVWDSKIADKSIPNSLFLSSKPGWFGSLKWPPYGPDESPTSVTGDLAKIPAGYRLVFGSNPPPESSGNVSNQSPTAIASASPTSGSSPLTVAFSSADTSDPEGTALTYNWAFGDGGFSSAANPSHTYSVPGTFIARLTVSDGVNSASSGDLIVSVAAPLINELPVAVAGASTLIGVAPLTVDFSGGNSADPEGASLTYHWSFGDGNTSTSANPSHAYTSPGNYFARLTVSDGNQSASSSNLAITVTSLANDLSLIAAANATPASGVVPLAVSFSSAGTFDPIGNATVYNWEFGDGTTSSSPNPTHTFQTAGNYVVQLTVSNGAESASSNPIAITVHSPGSGLVAAYGFEEGAGGTVRDASGNNNTGTLNGGTWAPDGKYGGALSFNGVSDLVVINGSASLNLGSAMTQEAWVYPTAPTSFQSTWSTILHRETDAYYLHVSSPQGSLRPAGGATYNGSESYVASPSVIPLNAWTHLAVTYDGTMMKLYVNGVQVASKAASGTIETNSNPLRIGGNVPYGQYFEGMIDEVRVYNRALSATEIINDLSAPVMDFDLRPPPPQNLRIATQ